MMTHVIVAVALVIPMVANTSANQYYDKECSVDYVDCVDGFLAGDSTTTCADACEGDCCVGLLACDSFTGKLCRD
jgi:hypothetical protein